ncbi:hypothetical protein JTE90_014134, partial [Oedothorax gibbosus]
MPQLSPPPPSVPRPNPFAGHTLG